jgi:hypothetical protein
MGTEQCDSWESGACMLIRMSVGSERDDGGAGSGWTSDWWPSGRRDRSIAAIERGRKDCTSRKEGRQGQEATNQKKVQQALRAQRRTTALY